MVKNPPPMQDTWVQIFDQENPLGEGNGNTLQYSCLGNSMKRGTWWSMVHSIAKSWKLTEVT